MQCDAKKIAAAIDAVELASFAVVMSFATNHQAIIVGIRHGLRWPKVQASGTMALHEPCVLSALRCIERRLLGQQLFIDPSVVSH